MYLPKEKDRIRTILAGTPLTAESIRLSEQTLGSEWHGTSWFFLMHLIAKSFTKEETISFNTMKSIVSDYGIGRWTVPGVLESELNNLAKVFKLRGLGNVHVDNESNLKIDGIISSAELRKYADSQYEYAMGSGLVRYSPGFRMWTARNMSNFAERIWWHYMTMVYDSPRTYDSPKEDSTLRALFQDMVEEMSSKDLSFHDVKIWTCDQLEHGLSLLEGWERNLISKNILRPFQFGEITFITPRYFPEIDLRSLKSGGKFKGEDMKSVLDFMESVRKLPAFPVHKGDRNSYDLCRRLERAGAVTTVEEVKGYSAPLYVYLISRDLFEEIDEKLKYSYAKMPMKEYGDISITDEIFRALGRARLFGQKILPGTDLMQRDYEHEIDVIFDSLETSGEAELGDLQNIFNPLQCLNILTIEDKKTTVNQDFKFVIKILSDFWNELINDPLIAKVELPRKEVVKRDELGQVRNQIKRSMQSYFVS
jgi:hypothetical protein